MVETYFFWNGPEYKNSGKVLKVKVLSKFCSGQNVKILK